MFSIFLGPCELWPGNYFEKFNKPNVTLREEVYNYGRQNLALIHVMIQSPYVTKIKRDVAMTFTTYIANSGGLLGLCVGFSFMSGIEILFYFCCLFKHLHKKFRMKKKNKVSDQVENKKLKKDSTALEEKQKSSSSEVELDNQDISQNDASIHKVLNDLVKTVNKLNASVIEISDEMNTIRDKLEIKNHKK